MRRWRRRSDAGADRGSVFQEQLAAALVAARIWSDRHIADDHRARAVDICQPISAAKLDFWQADDSGNYDNSGFRLRGHQFTDADGRYTLQTIVPGLYPGRTRHIHVKAQAPNQSILTTQLYFPNEARNATDGIFSSELLMTVNEVAGGRAATFDFVL